MNITKGSLETPPAGFPSDIARSERRTVVRYFVLAFLFTITAINYGDRATLGIARSTRISHT
ncbi:hypothetical protein WSS15_17250 [Acetobacter pasteurianus]|uniref:hypothetical protein n=1 Tax=Acetobacter pasteurianus TaxID=438 RepID=UPI0022C6A453|nr:hypothetical protein [Acetobacter pasteurianus]GLH29075.1 hypothetical protein WSS15_17250 [Acetobacter pasteurianus]